MYMNIKVKLRVSDRIRVVLWGRVRVGVRLTVGVRIMVLLGRLE